MYSYTMRRIFLLAALTSSLALAAQSSVETERQYLSGHGCDDMVEWDFQCSDGRNSGKWTKVQYKNKTGYVQRKYLTFFTG